MTLLSRIMGFVRDMVLARTFGASLVLDAFLVAFKIPNMLRRFFGEGAFSLAFVPVLSEYKEQQGQDAVRALVQRVAGTMILILLLVSIVGSLAAPALVTLIAPGFLDDPAQFDITTAMLRVTFPYIFFISLVAFASSILNTYGRFAAPAFSPVLLNAVLILAATVAAPYFEHPIMAMAWGVFLAGIIQLVFVLPGIIKLRLLVKPSWGGKDPGVRRILKLMGPALFGSSVAQINMLLDTLIASFLVAGSISWLYLADRMVEFPLGVFGIALSTVILPSLSQQHASKNTHQFSLLLDRALRWVMLLGTPAAIGLLWLAGPIIVTLFQYDKVTPFQAEMTALALMTYAIALPAFILVKVLVPAFYSRQDARTPVKVGIYAMLANMVLNVLIVVPMVLLDYRAPHIGLVIASVISAWLNFWLLYRRLRFEGVYQPEAGWKQVILRVMFASGVMMLILWWGPKNFDELLPLSGMERAFDLTLWVMVSGAAYLLSLQLTGQKLHLLWRRPDRLPPQA